MAQAKNQVVALYNNANKLYKAKLYKEALEYYTKVAQLDLTFYDAHFCVAKTLVRLGDFDKGIDIFKKYFHLIPNEKQAAYSIGLSGILVEEKQNEKAYELCKIYVGSADEKQQMTIFNIFLANGKIKEVLLGMLKLPQEDATDVLNQLLANDTIEQQHKNNLRKQNVIPKYHDSKKRFNTLEGILLENEEYKNTLNKINKSFKSFTKKGDLKENIEAIDIQIGELQEILMKQGEVILKTNNLSFAKRILSVLEATKYDSKKNKLFSDKIIAIKKEKNKKITKIVTISVTALLIISVVSYFGYNSYQKSKAYERAISSKSLYDYDYYLNKYGDKEDIHKLREEKLFANAIESNTSRTMQSLVNKYPNSSKLCTIKYTNISNESSFSIYGINSSESKLDGSKEANTLIYKIPIGCKIGYTINEYNKLPVEKFITIGKSLSINEKLIDAETLIFEDSFNNNHNKWDTFNKIKEDYYGKKNKGVKVNNGVLNLYHQYNDNKFVYSTINLSKIRKSSDFKIVAKIQRNGFNNGTFLIFGATKRAFNYIGFTSSRKYIFGYNNWDNSSENWIKQSGNWPSNSSINNGRNDINILQIIKRNNNLTYLINDSFIGETNLKKWYGSRIGFGINDNTNSNILGINIYNLNKPKKIDFKDESVYYCWVNELNVRDSSVKGEILTTIKIGDPVKYLGEVGTKKVNATFKEQYKPDYYYKVELLDGTIGWVHGGALCEINAIDNPQFSDFK